MVSSVTDSKAMKIFLLINVCVWVPYALVCTFAPGLLAGEVVEGLVVFDQSGWVEKVEVRAMYGGAQLAIGLFALVALLKPQHRTAAVIFYLLLFSGLSLVRIAGLLIDGPGLAFTFSTQVDPASYNGGALWCFEFPMMLYAAFLFLKSDQ